MSNPFKSIIFGYSADDLFFFAFNVNMGLLPPFITLADSKALQLPLIFTAFVIYLRLLVRPQVFSRFTKTMRTPNTLLILALFGILVISAITADYTKEDPVRISLKIGLVLLILTTLRYTVSNRCEINQFLLGRFLVTGVIIGILIIACLSYWSDASLIQYLDHQFEMVEVNKLNRALEVLSVLVFLCAFGFKNHLTSIAVIILLSASVYLMSFYVVGSIFWNGALRSRIHIDSETVQFGFPIAFIVFLLGLKYHKLMINIVFGGISVLLLTAPWIFQIIYKLSNSLLDPSMSNGIRKIMVRAEIWDLVAKTSLSSPIFGHGIDSARYLGNIVVHGGNSPSIVYLHPHNMILQLWLDLGSSGVLIIFGLLLLGWRFMNNISTNFHAPILGGLTMLTVFSVVTHSLWQTWSLSLITIFLTIIATLKLESNNQESIQQVSNADN